MVNVLLGLTVGRDRLRRKCPRTFTITVKRCREGLDDFEFRVALLAATVGYIVVYDRASSQNAGLFKQFPLSLADQSHDSRQRCDGEHDGRPAVIHPDGLPARCSALRRSSSRKATTTSAARRSSPSGVTVQGSRSQSAPLDKLYDGPARVSCCCRCEPR